MTACSTGFQRPSCLQQSLKFLQPNLAPFLPAVNALASTAVCLLLPPPSRLGPGALAPMAKENSSSGCSPCPTEPSEAQALAHPLWPLVLVQPHRLWLKLGSGMPAVPRWMSTYVRIHLVDLGMPVHVLCCQNLAAPTSALTNPSLPHQSLLPLGWADAGPGQGLWLPRAQEAGRRSIH